ncbi:MAG: crossover junction endodeoxyribonuclease RuvC [Candidatus Andersenbacteria bacterium]
MVILGLDPGIARTGFGVINTTVAQSFVRCGCLTTPSHEATPDRLWTIGQDLTTLLTTYKPDHAVVETVFFGANSKTAIITAQTSGVLLYILRQHRIPVHTLTPLQIKSRLTGYGAADKQQVQTLVTRRLKLPTVPQPDDAADALAAALCLTEESLSIAR